MGPDLKFGQPVKKASSPSARQGEPKPNPTATRSEETRISALALIDTNPAYLDVLKCARYVSGSQVGGHVRSGVSTWATGTWALHVRAGAYKNGVLDPPDHSL